MVSNGSGGFVGFNPRNIEFNWKACLDCVESIYSEINRTFEDILWGMEQHWAAPEAEIYCENLKDRMGSILQSSGAKLRIVMTEIREAVHNWCITTDYKNMKLSIDSFDNLHSSIKSYKCFTNWNGVVGIDVEEFTELLNRYRKNDNIKSHLNSFSYQLDLFGFIGGGQQKALTESVRGVCCQFDRSLTEFIEEITDNMSKIVEKYKDTAGEVYKQFKEPRYIVHPREIT